MSGSRSKAKTTYKLGDVLEGVETVTRPGGSEITVTGGLYVIDAVGDHVINGEEVTVK